MENYACKYSKEQFLLNKFNKRDELSFSEVYTQIFDELNHFASRLFYATSVDSEDLVQDIFVSVWANGKITFVSIDHIKNYMYQSIKNKHKDFLKHKMCVNEYNQRMKEIEDYQFSAMVETEIISILSLIDDILPAECAKVIKLLLQGYEVKEISEKLSKSQFTVYHQRNEAVNILRKYTHSKKITFVLNFLNFI